MSSKTRRHVKGTMSDYIGSRRTVTKADVLYWMQTGLWQLAKLRATPDQLVVMATIEKAIRN